jgi:hypothetical protein
MDEINRTAEEMLAEALEGEKVGARKLTFPEKCGAFAALYSGVRNQVVARAFDISIQATSNLSGCLEYDPDPYREEYATGERADGAFHNPDLEAPMRVLRDHNRNRNPNRHRHYQDVGREFEALGAEEFIRRYYNERTHKRIILAKVQLRDEAKRSQRDKRDGRDARTSREASDARWENSRK